MKKMPYAIIFLVLLALLVFAGCKSFSSGGDDSSSDESAGSAASQEDTEKTDAASETESETPSGSEPVTEEPSADAVTTEAPVTDPDEVTDANGVTVYTPEEASSIREAVKTTETTVPPDNSSATAKPEPTSPSTTGANTQPSTTKAPEPTTGAVPQNTKFDLLRSGRFYLAGSMISEGESNPIVLALDDNLVYMQATSDELSMGFLIMDKKTYLLNPTDKTYCKLNATVAALMQEAGMMSESEIRSMISNFGFSSLKPLDQADAVSAGTLGSKNCTVYTFNNESDGGKKRVYMDGAELLAIENIAADGTMDSAIYITTLTDKIPTLPPADYKSKNLISFISDISSLMD